MKKYLAIIILLMSTTVYSETNLVVGLFTRHFERNQYMNNNNHQIGIEHNKWYLQYMINSFDDDTLSLSRNFYNKRGFYLGLGASYGYRESKILYSDNKHFKWENTSQLYGRLSGLAYVGYTYNIDERLGINVTLSDCVNVTLKINLDR